MPNTIQFGRQSVDRTILEQAVKASHSVRDVQKLLDIGLAATNTTKLGEAIQAAGINTDHFTSPIGGKHFDRQLKQYNIAAVNKPYFDWAEAELPKTLSAESYKGTYRFIFGNFLESIGEQDLIKTSEEQITKFAEGKIMRENVIKAMLKRIVLDNVNKSRFNVGKALLFCLLDDGKMKK